MRSCVVVVETDVFLICEKSAVFLEPKSIQMAKGSCDLGFWNTYQSVPSKSFYSPLWKLAHLFQRRKVARRVADRFCSNQLDEIICHWNCSPETGTNENPKKLNQENIYLTAPHSQGYALILAKIVTISFTFGCDACA